MTLQEKFEEIIKIDQQISTLEYEIDQLSQKKYNLKGQIVDVKHAQIILDEKNSIISTKNEIEELAAKRDELSNYIIDELNLIEIEKVSIRVEDSYWTVCKTTEAVNNGLYDVNEATLTYFIS